MIIKNFKTTRVEQQCQLEHPRDWKLGQILYVWDEVLSNMKPGDVPNGDTLTDCLLRKIKNSNLMADMRAYESMVEGDHEKSCNDLRKMMNKFIEKRIEDKMITEKNQG